MLAVWPLLVAAGPPAPMPPGGFAGGITGLPRALDGAVGDVRGGGFNAVRIFLRWDKIETAEGTPDWTCKYLTRTDVGPLATARPTRGRGRPAAPRHVAVGTPPTTG